MTFNRGGEKNDIWDMVLSWFGIQEAEDREKMLPDLRKESRRNYLAKRKVDKLQELELDVMDDEFLFDETSLTEREKVERR